MDDTKRPKGRIKKLATYAGWISELLKPSYGAPVFLPY